MELKKVAIYGVILLAIPIVFLYLIPDVFFIILNFIPWEFSGYVFYGVIGCGLIGFLMILYAFSERQERDTTSRIRDRASYGECDYCGSDLGRRYTSCRVCKKVFCSDLCLEMHISDRHSGQ